MGNEDTRLNNEEMLINVHNELDKHIRLNKTILESYYRLLFSLDILTSVLLKKGVIAREDLEEGSALLTERFERLEKKMKALESESTEEETAELFYKVFGKGKIENA